MSPMVFWVWLLVVIAGMTIRAVAGKAALLHVLAFAGLSMLSILLIIFIAFLIGFGWRLSALLFDDEEGWRS